MRDNLLIILLAVFLIFWFFVMPMGVGYGIINGDLDIETLEPVGSRAVEGGFIHEDI